VVSVVPRGLYRAAVAAGTGPARASYDVDAAFMHVERHERGIHALCAGAAEAGVTEARFPAPAAAGAGAGARADHDQLKQNGIELWRHERGNHAV
jgi:hypothetical protein